MRLAGVHKTGQKGVALTVAIMMIICSSVLAGYAMQAGWNMRRIQISSGSIRDRAYWYAKAGVVNARWRIRTNQGGVFANPASDPAAYTLDVNGDGTNDVTVNIGPENANGLRQIDSGSPI